MGADLADDYNIADSEDKKCLEDGFCQHCRRHVKFKDPDEEACLVFSPSLVDNTELSRKEYLIMGICPRKECQKPTIVYYVEEFYYNAMRSSRIIVKQIVYPIHSSRNELKEEIPAELRKLYDEAASIENLSPNGCAFLARRILEQTLREHFQKPQGKLYDLIGIFIYNENLSLEFREMMEMVRGFGNMAAHPKRSQEGEWLSVDFREAQYLLDVISELLEHIYVKPARRKGMLNRLQAKNNGCSLSPLSHNDIVIGNQKIDPPKEPEGDNDIPF